MAKTDAENAYRSERKERIANASKKKSAKKADSTTIISRIIIVLLVIALIAGCCGMLWWFGVPQKWIPALKVGEKTYYMPEYNYYYTSVFQNYANQASSQQESYGFNLTGFDYSKDPAVQTTKDEDGNEITFDQLFRDQVKETLESYDYYLKKAAEEGVELNEDSKAEIEETVSQIATYAKNYSYSTDRYISVLYGKGLNEKRFRSILETQYLVSQYLEDQQSEIAEGITMDEINAKFEEDPDAYKVVDLRLLGIAIEKDESAETEEETAAETAEETAPAEEATEAAQTAEGETAAETAEETEPAAEENAEPAAPSEAELLANEMLSRVTDEASFIELAKEYCAEADKETFKDPSASLAKSISKSTVSTNISEELAEWLFDDARVLGDKRVFVASDYAYVIYMLGPAYTNDQPLASARHILISFDSVKEDEAAAENETAAETEAAVDETAEAAQDETAAETAETTTAAETAPANETAPADETAAEATPENGTAVASDGTEITNDGTSQTLDTVLKAYEKAAGILAEYKNGEQTEEAFAALAEQYSTDTGSIGENGEGGLYENIELGKMVAPFEDWVYDEARQPGDVGIVMSNYGWHIMYYVGHADEAAWIANIRNDIATEKNEAAQEEVKTATENAATETAFTAFCQKSALKHVNKTFVSQEG